MSEPVPHATAPGSAPGRAATSLVRAYLAMAVGTALFTSQVVAPNATVVRWINPATLTVLAGVCASMVLLGLIGLRRMPTEPGATGLIRLTVACHGVFLVCLLPSLAETVVDLLSGALGRVWLGPSVQEQLTLDWTATLAHTVWLVSLICFALVLGRLAGTLADGALRRHAQAIVLLLATTVVLGVRQNAGPASGGQATVAPGWRTTEVSHGGQWATVVGPSGTAIVDGARRAVLPALPVGTRQHRWLRASDAPTSAGPGAGVRVEALEPLPVNVGPGPLCLGLEITPGTDTPDVHWILEPTAEGVRTQAFLRAREPVRVLHRLSRHQLLILADSSAELLVLDLARAQLRPLRANMAALTLVGAQGGRVFLLDPNLGWLYSHGADGTPPHRYPGVEAVLALTGEAVITTSPRGMIRRVPRRYPGSGPARLLAHRDGSYWLGDVERSPDGQHLAWSVEGRLMVIELATGRSYQAVDVGSQYMSHMSNKVGNHARFSWIDDRIIRLQRVARARSHSGLFGRLLGLLGLSTYTPDRREWVDVDWSHSRLLRGVAAEPPTRRHAGIGSIPRGWPAPSGWVTRGRFWWPADAPRALRYDPPPTPPLTIATGASLVALFLALAAAAHRLRRRVAQVDMTPRPS